MSTTASSARIDDPASLSIPELTFDLSTALRAFDAVHADSSVAPVGLPSSYDSASGVLPIIADRVSLPDNLQHVSILSKLPDTVAARYATPSAVLLPPEVAADRVGAARLRKPRVLAARTEYIKLVHRMLRLGMLQLTSTPHCVNSLFGVPKGDDIRLILDARLANCYFVGRTPCPTPFPVAPCSAASDGALCRSQV